MEYLQKRVDQPRAWANVFGAVLVIPGILIGYEEAGFVGACIGAAIGLSVGRERPGPLF
jgi:hypothetical protein